MSAIASTLTLTPFSSLTQPLLVRPGESVTFEATVVNPSGRPDRFRLACAQWPPDALTLVYPQAETAADALSLSPGERGTVLLSLVPPANLPAGAYQPTLRLISANNPDLTVMQPIYLKVVPPSPAALATAAAGAATALVKADPTDSRVDSSARLEQWPIASTQRSRLWLLLPLGGLLLGLGWLGWWLTRSPAQPQIVEFYPEKSDYGANSSGAEVGWQIANADQVGSLKLTGYDPQGKQVSGPISFDLSQALPPELAAHCTLSSRILNCRNVPTQAQQPGQYLFELTLLPRQPERQAVQRSTSSLVTLEGLPVPQIAELVPSQIVYAEAGRSSGAAAPLGPGGVTLSWVVTAPNGLQDLLLVVRQADGSVWGGRRYSFRNPARPREVAVPPELAKLCQLKTTLVCQAVPTGVAQVGRYTFELSAVPVGQSTAAAAPRKTELVQIQPQPVGIAAFELNGQPAPARYLLPVESGQPAPELVLSWVAVGGSTARAVLLPAPGTVPLQGRTRLPVSPAGETTLALQVSNGTGEPVVRSVTVVTYDPTPNSEAAAQAAQAAEAAQAAQAAAQAAARTRAQPSPNAAENSPPRPPLPAATEAGRLSPAEAPPNLD